VSQKLATFTSTTVPANSDDTYLIDRWVLLSEGNDIVDVYQSTTAPAGFKNSIKLEVETANKQFGVLQILENKDSIKYANGVSSLSFQARMAAADDNTHSLKAVVLSWSSTADVVTSDVVDAWGGTPTYVANWTAENSPDSNTLTTSWQTFKIENISIDTASMANLAVFIFCDQTDGVVDDAIYITGIKLEQSSIATTYTSKYYAEELAICKRYGEMIAPGIVYGYYCTLLFTATTSALALIPFTEKRIIPTVTISDVTKFLVGYAASITASTGIAATFQTTKITRLIITTAAVLTAGQSGTLQGENSATTHWIYIDAEL
jgi:hypothetical protein